MSNQQILEKAIQKAIDGGWNVVGSEIPATFTFRYIQNNAIIGVLHIDGHDVQHREPLNAERIIFNHDFAKALWGEEEYEGNPIGDPQGTLRDWQYHLQQMVIADDPIQYLGDNI